MATGKETPRQRMIGMMYLVLTALLALQVSSAVIEKFYALNESIETSVTNASIYNGDRLKDIKEAVKERGNRSDEVLLAKNAQALREKTEAMRAYMEKLKTELIVKTGGYDEDGNLKGAKEETEVEVYMLGTNKSNGKAYELQNKLNEYVAFVNASSKIKFAPFALDAKDDPIYKNNADQKNKDFAQVNFAQTPLVAAMAVVSDLETYYEYKDYKGEENFMIRVSETQNEAETYFFSIKNFGWINCDRFYEDSREKKDFIAQFILPSNEKNVAESYNYIVFDSLMSVIPIYKDASGHWVCPNLPLGEAITCISIQKAGNRLYYGSRKTHVGNWVLTVRLQEIKEQELEKLLELTL